MDRAADVELDTGDGEFVSDVSDIWHRSGEAIELGDDQHVAGTAGGQRFAEAGACAVGASQPVVDVDPLGVDAEPGQAVALGGEVLPCGGDPGIADFDLRHSCSVAD